MGSRGRSIRLRIYFLVAIPLITMLGLFGYVAAKSINNWLNLDRAPNLIQATSEPLTNFVNLLQGERRAAVVYLSQPDGANLSSYQRAIGTAKDGAQQLAVALNSPGTKNSATPAETAAIDKMTAQINGMTPLRTAVAAKKLSPLDALTDYTNIIAGQGAVLQAEANSITDATAVIQGLGLISAVNTQEDMSEQDAVLASALVSGSLTGPDRVAFSQAAGRQQDDTLTYQELLTPAELAIYTGTVNKMAPTAVRNGLVTVQDAVLAGTPLHELEQQGLTAARWQTMTGTWLKASSTAGTTTASTVLATNEQTAINAKRGVLVLGILGAAGLILTLIVSLLLSRSINRRLTTLRRSALTLAQEQLPAVVGRLRRGESVDVAAEAPPLRVGNDEIGQVGQAIDIVRQTAIRSAVEEARVRQGVNDMFRNLARRNQSLLQRQLAVLDEMERRATDPDVLEDLFKMDHLTTRMRRHAEGLIILSGAPPGRSWSAPVRLIDVMRGAVAEVEDYARATVSTQSRAALAGSAVTDVIHLLAELIENATTLSPPFTQVRVGGETAANGFAIEIEDRGLGMTPQKLHELNERLANPPEINPANTEQLGLFVVGQLARRHGISVTLRPSPFGGITAVALIPLELIVEEGPAAITAGGRAAAAAGPAGNGTYGSGAYSGDTYGNGYAGAAAGGAGPAGDPATRRGASAWPPGIRPDVDASYGVPGAPEAPAAYGGPGPAPARAGYPHSGASGPGDPAGPGGYDAGSRDPGRPTIRISGALRHPSATGGFTAASGPGTSASPAESGIRRGRHGTDDVPVVTGVPVGRPATSPVPPFDVFTPIKRSGRDGAAPADVSYPQSYAGPQPHPDLGVPATGTGTSASPYGGAPAGTAYQDTGTAYQDTGPYQDQEHETYPGGTAYGDSGAYAGDPAFGNNGDGAGGSPDGDPAGTSAGDVNGLPRRVRQASLAPELRSSAAAAGPRGETAVPPATAASLADMRNTLSAMQRGWQQGRSQTQRDTEGTGDGD